MTVNLAVSPIRGATASQRVPVNSFKEASAVCREFIDQNWLTVESWIGGEVYDETGKEIAFVSYNGRVWKDKNTAPHCEEIPI